MADVRDNYLKPCSPRSAACTTRSSNLDLALRTSRGEAAVQIETEAAIQTGLRLAHQTSAEFVASVSAISRHPARHRHAIRVLQRDGLVVHPAESRDVTPLSPQAPRSSAHVRRAVITRLQVLQQYMAAQVQGRSAAISIAGQDEITEMAKATKFFVIELKRRENARAAAKEAAEAARDVAERARADAATARADVERTR